ncbi:hypothetical protein SAMN05421878_1244 [Actinobaculum suis]|uniref:Uncharacterized protein n=2 Tax=Actinobaculum suis TaxID=1657 RepID=A0A1G7EUR1_9ACTO|nr:hypothetical protein SAMN05421878_1244 [Actinobaculum suis]
MNHWMNETRLEVETFILKGTTVTFPEYFASQHDELLVSTTADLAEAAREFFSWQAEYVGGFDSTYLERIQALTEVLK